MRILIKSLVTGLVLLVLIGSGLLYLSTHFLAPGKTVIINQNRQESTMPVVIAPVRVDAAAERVEVVGSLLANESVVIRPEIAGRIQSLNFAEGQAVKKGQPLVFLDPAEYQAEVAQREAAVTLWQLKFRRAKELLDKKVLSKQEYDEMEAALKEAQAGLALARTRLEKMTLRAPFSGVLGLRRVSPGDYVEAGQELVNLEAIDPIKIDLRVAERHTEQVRAGQVATIRVDAYPDKAFKGKIYAVDPRLEEGSRSVLLRGHLPNPEGELRPGMFARATLLLRERERALWAPEQALVPLGDEQFVYRVVEGKAVLTRVETGLRRPGEVEVRNGLEAGDLVITDGQMRIQDGMPVMAINLPSLGVDKLPHG